MLDLPTKITSTFEVICSSNDSNSAQKAEIDDDGGRQIEKNFNRKSGY